jgi:hypothetical protein
MDNYAKNNYRTNKALRCEKSDKTAGDGNSRGSLKSDNILKSLLSKPSMQKDFMREYLPEEANKKLNFDSILIPIF